VGERNGPAGRLDVALDRALRPWRAASDPLALLYSGGLDSSVIAWELRSRPRFQLFTIGTRESPDLRAAEEGARILELPWVPAVVTAADVEEVRARVALELSGLSPVQRSVQLSFATALARAPSVPLLCGQGADELFLGYAHYRGIDPGTAGARADADLERLIRDDWPRSLRIAGILGRAVAAPYLDPGFVAAARSIPLERRLPTPEPKAFFRDWAIGRGLPGPLARRPKRALQYGSGIDRLLRPRR